MFNIGFSEMLFLGVLALLLIGPKQLPEVARTVGRLLNEFKRATNVLTDEIKNHRDEFVKQVETEREKIIKGDDIQKNQQAEQAQQQSASPPAPEPTPEPAREPAPAANTIPYSVTAAVGLKEITKKDEKPEHK